MKLPENQRTEFPMISPPKLTRNLTGTFLKAFLFLFWRAGGFCSDLCEFLFSIMKPSTSFSDEPKQRQSMETISALCILRKNRWPTWEFAPLENSRWNIQIIKSFKNHTMKITEFQREIPIPAKWVLNIFLSSTSQNLHWPFWRLGGWPSIFMDQSFKHSMISRYIDTLPPKKKNREKNPPLPRKKVRPQVSQVFFRGGESQRAHKPLKRGSVS